MPFKDKNEQRQYGIDYRKKNKIKIHDYFENLRLQGILKIYRETYNKKYGSLSIG